MENNPRDYGRGKYVLSTQKKKINLSNICKILLIAIITIFIFLGTITQLKAQEMKLLDEVFTATEAEHGFHYFLADTTFSDNWIEPINFYEGLIHLRFEILDYPSEEPFLLQICIWSDVEGNWESWSETCAKRVPISGRGVFSVATKPPSTWWQYNKDKPVDYSRVKDFKKLGIVYWCANRKNLSDWVPEEESCWPERNIYFPMKMRVTVVAVAKGYEFSGWDGFITSKNIIK